MKNTVHVLFPMTNILCFTTSTFQVCAHCPVRLFSVVPAYHAFQTYCSDKTPQIRQDGELFSLLFSPMKLKLTEELDGTVYHEKNVFICVNIESDCKVNAQY